MRAIVTAAVLIAALMAPAHAEKNYFGNAGDFVDAYHHGNSKENLLLRIFIRGIGEGIGALNAWEKVSGAKPAYCPPPNIALVDAQLVSILADHIAKYPSLKDNPVSLVMISALEDVFPCGAQ